MAVTAVLFPYAIVAKSTVAKTVLRRSATKNFEEIFHSLTIFIYYVSFLLYRHRSEFLERMKQDYKI